MKILLVLFLMFSGVFSVQAAVISTPIEYKDGDTVLEGFLAYDNAFPGPRPGILIVHEWKGIGPFVKDKAQQLARLGYVAFAADIYGKGIRPKTNEEAGQQAGFYKNDRALLRRRAMSGLEVLKSSHLANPQKIAAIGYCFGGTTVLELARSGADLAGVVSLHGGLDTPDPGDARDIKAKVLVLHGSDDPHVSAQEVQAFQEEMRAAGADWQLISYGGAVHSFTNPEAGNDPGQGAAYNRQADERSWQAMQGFFKEIFNR